MSFGWRSSVWPRRIVITTGLWAGVFGSMVIGEMGPRPALLAGSVAIVAVGCWLVVDVGRVVTTANWYADSAARSRGGDDRRADRLRRSIERTATSDGSLDMLTPVLVDLIDHRVKETHGVDRHADPARFAEIVGPELDDFVRTSESASRRYQLPALECIIARIETL